MGFPSKYDLQIYRGDKVYFKFQLSTDDGSGAVPVNLTGKTILAQVRQEEDSATVYATFTVLDRDDANGIFALSFTPTQTAAFTWTSGVYDIQISNVGDTQVDTLIYGVISITKDVSRI